MMKGRKRMRLVRTRTLLLCTVYTCIHCTHVYGHDNVLYNVYCLYVTTCVFKNYSYSS